MMRIVHVLTRMRRGGSEENTAEVCRWQAAAGHEVWLVHGGDAHPCWNGRMPGVRRLALANLVHPVDPMRDLRALRMLRRLFADLAPDVIHTHQSKAGVIGRLAAMGQGAWVVHGMHILPAPGTLMRAAERRAAALTDRFIGVSRAVGDAHVALGLARAERTECVRSGLDLARFQTAGPPPDWRALLGCGADRPPVVLVLAALEARKNHAAFLRGWAAMRDAVPDAHVLIAGDGPEAGSLAALVCTLGLQDRVHLVGHRDDPERLVALADMVCLPSEREGLPRVAVQALAGGRPFLSTRLPGLSEVVVPGVTGVTADDGGGVARAALGLLGDQARLARMQAAARGSDLSAWALAALGPATTRAYGLGPGVTRRVA
ncbi:glycosyltransferase family 4 protein [Roseivivax sp. CAU 1753]